MEEKLSLKCQAEMKPWTETVLEILGCKSISEIFIRRGTHCNESAHGDYH